MIRINLLPARVTRKKKAGRQQLVLLVLLVVVVLVANGIWSQSRRADLTAREQRMRRTRESIAQLEKIIGEVKSIKAQQAVVKDKLAVLDRLKAGKQGPVRVLDELASTIPAKLWLRKFDEKAGAVTFDGTAASIDEVSAFLAALKRSQYFGSPELKKTTARSEKGLKLVDFNVTATVNYTPGVKVAAASPAPPSAGKP
jgi:type IV pilus assembly protein PilN